MKAPKWLLAMLSLPLLCANHVPASTDQQLAAKSDLVIVGRVAAIDVMPPRAVPDRIESREIVIGSIVSRPCVQVAVERQLKGAAAGSVVVCPSRVAELNPKPQQLGKRYTMFLRSEGAVYIATSWDGVKELHPT